MTKKRLQTVLAHAGIASRRHAAELIERGKVQVDGSTVTEKGYRIDPDMHEVRVNGRPLSGEKKYYFLFNKPGDVISTVRDTHGRRKVTDFFKKINARLYPVGRLDKDTTGLIIVTNDGGLTHKLTHPSFKVEKEYVAEVSPCPAPGSIRCIERGVMVEGRVTAPCEIKLVRKKNAGAVYRVKLHEGRKRQIKHMFEAAGARVVKLKREKYAGLTLKGLKEGSFRKLTAKEVEKLKSM